MYKKVILILTGDKTFPLLSCPPSNPVQEFQLMQIILTQVHQTGQENCTKEYILISDGDLVQHLAFIADTKFSIFLDKDRARLGLVKVR